MQRFFNFHWFLANSKFWVLFEMGDTKFSLTVLIILIKFLQDLDILLRFRRFVCLYSASEKYIRMTVVLFCFWFPLTYYVNFLPYEWRHGWLVLAFKMYYENIRKNFVGKIEHQISVNVSLFVERLTKYCIFDHLKLYIDPVWFVWY